MRTLSDLSKEAEQYFRQMELDKDAAREAYRHILSTINAALSTQELSAMPGLIPYIEEGDGHLAFQYIGKTHRFLRMLHIIELEQKYHKILFCSDCRSAESLWEKYMLTLFAFRRILFRLSEDSAAEAVQYLQNRPVSHFAAYIMTQDELLAPDQRFYETLASIFAEYWSDLDMQQFFTLTGTASQTPQGDLL
ncbi:MAG: hypothetical protein J6C84_07775 [Lachnospiraceae bacterium]|nr:hypothetical protein [Lachnospiraceae bacterium]